MVFPIAISLAASLPFLGLLACGLFDEKTVRMIEASARERRGSHPSAHLQQSEDWYGGRTARETFSLLPRG